ncbi:HSP70-domain-containing protein [Rickenella mellea]|uniref:HSP70-domain-containing protein n=1 Tax=Rickenella mellea TaxID=50990 RepID=A0A4Y7PWR3_9AGAM|nr:HSP70-domain-containing protein [Rickenella mellea]
MVSNSKETETNAFQRTTLVLSSAKDIAHARMLAAQAAKTAATYLQTQLLWKLKAAEIQLQLRVVQAEDARADWETAKASYDKMKPQLMTSDDEGDESDRSEEIAMECELMTSDDGSDEGGEGDVGDSREDPATELPECLSITGGNCKRKSKHWCFLPTITPSCEDLRKLRIATKVRWGIRGSVKYAVLETNAGNADTPGPGGPLLRTAGNHRLDQAETSIRGPSPVVIILDLQVVFILERRVVPGASHDRIVLMKEFMTPAFRLATVSSSNSNDRSYKCTSEAIAIGDDAHLGVLKNPTNTFSEARGEGPLQREDRPACAHIPRVVKFVLDCVNGKEPNKGINSDDPVAYGAAAQADILWGDTSQKTQDLHMLDVTPLSLTIDTLINPTKPSPPRASLKNISASKP